MPNRIRSNFNHEVSIWLRPHCLNSLQISPRRKGKGIQFSITGIVVYLLNHAQLFSNSMDCSPPGSSVHGISQARILEWVAFSFSRESSWLKDQTHASCIGRQVFTTEPGGKPITEIQCGKIVQKRLQNCRNKTMCVLESCELFFHFVTNFKKWQHIIHMPFYGSPVDKANIKSCIPSQR